MTIGTPTVHAIILNWNRADDTLACLASLQASAYARLRVLVVDQASHDGSPARIRAAFPDVDVLELPANVGFAAGMNAGMRHALTQGATHLLLLNNDTVVDAGMVAALVAALGPGVGMTGPAIYYHAAPSQLWSQGGDLHPLLLEMSGDHGRAWPLPDRPTPRGFLSGCALLIPRRTVERVGLWDERFFMYYEDLDYCLRVQRAGLALVLVPAAVLWHKVATSSGGPSSPAERYHMARSSGLYFRKHLTVWRAPAILAFRGASALRWSWRLARRSQWTALAAYWRGLVEGWLGPVPPARNGAQ